MSYDSGNRWTARTSPHAGLTDVDAGLRSYMLRVYNYMAAGLAITGIVAYLVASSPELLRTIYGTPLSWLVMLAPLGFVLVLSFGIQRLSLGTTQLLFWAFSGVMGLSLSWIFIRYTGTSIARVFFISGGTFLGMSLYGYTTRADLTRFGAFLFMGLIGIVIASLVNLFLGSASLQFAISVIGVLVFVGLTAFDTQRIKEMYWEGDDGTIAGKKAIMGALTLYLDFINLFIMLLQLFGNRRD